MNVDDRVERFLADGHPEVDDYDPPALDLSREPKAIRRGRRSLATALAAAAVVLGVVVLGAWRLETGRTAAAPDPSPTVGSTRPAPSVSPRNPKGLRLEIVESPESELTAAILAADGPCMSERMPLLIPPDGDALDQQIAESGIKQGWLIVDSRWLGEDRVALAEAFGAVRAATAAETADVVWVLTARDGIRRAIELVALETPLGHLVWMPRRSISEAPCKEPVPPLSIPVVERPHDAASAEMVKRGVRCFTGSDVLMVFDPDGVDFEIDKKQIDQGWLHAGRTWVGEDPMPMILATGSSWAVAGPDRDEVWSIIDRDGTLESRGYYRFETSKGRIVWVQRNADREATC